MVVPSELHDGDTGKHRRNDMGYGDRAHKATGSVGYDHAAKVATSHSKLGRLNSLDRALPRLGADGAMGATRCESPASGLQLR